MSTSPRRDGRAPLARGKTSRCRAPDRITGPWLALDLATRDLWPQDEAAVTALDFAQLALLRLLRLQRETRRAVRTRQREAAALLARTSMETCILGRVRLV